MSDRPQNGPSPVYTLSQAAQRLGMASRSIANIARQRGLCSSIGREPTFSESDLTALMKIMRGSAHDPNRTTPSIRPKRPFGIHESKELRKERRRVKKRQPPKIV